ncbi:MAG TPA: hypothetical protein VET25_01525 [Aestuariivirgaceae bacterium]|nr:hypothetical protein [Aestuariivirgaceae bacterium]
MKPLLMAGFASIACGVLAIVFGFSIYEFSLGNSLIVAGTIGLVGGMLTIGLSLILDRIVEMRDALNHAIATPLEAERAPAAAAFHPEHDGERHVFQDDHHPTLEHPDQDELLPPDEDMRRPMRAFIDRLLPAEEPRPQRLGLGEPSFQAAEQRPFARPFYAQDNNARSRHSDDVVVARSGIIEGMAYTLFTDGSIEAELPTGTMRFTSLAELRAFVSQPDKLFSSERVS